MTDAVLQSTLARLTRASGSILTENSHSVSHIVSPRNHSHGHNHSHSPNSHNHSEGRSRGGALIHALSLDSTDADPDPGPGLDPGLDLDPALVSAPGSDDDIGELGRTNGSGDGGMDVIEALAEVGCRPPPLLNLHPLSYPLLYLHPV